ncbi:hypothetical protein [Planobispora takensis]|nr:hypothetical protein [Planobispora takensis]
MPDRFLPADVRVRRSRSVCPPEKNRVANPYQPPRKHHNQYEP